MINTLLVLAYKLLLDVVFLFYIRPTYSYEPYLSQYDESDFGKWLFASGLTVVLWLFIRGLHSRGMRVSAFYILVQFFIVVVPSLVLFGMQDRPYFHVLLLCGSLFLLIAIVGLTPRILIPPPPALVAYSLVVIGLGCCAYVYLGLIATGGLGRLNFNLYSVYDVRDEYKNAMLPGFGYMVSWVAYAINTAFLVYFFSRKHWTLVLCVIVAQFLLFGMTNFKTFLFIPFVALGLVVARKYLSLSRLMLLGLFAAIGAGLVINAIGEPMGLSIVRRALFVPAGLHGVYFDYFSSMPNSAMSGTRFASLFSAPYDSTSVSLVAWAFWGRELSPNVGWVGDAFAQFNWVGVLVYTTVFGVLLTLADNLVALVPRQYKEMEGLLVGSAIALCNSSLTAVMLTHGLFITLIVLWTLSYFWRATLAKP